MSHSVTRGIMGSADKDFDTFDGLCEFCDEPITDDECDCTGTVVGGDVVLLPEWAPGERGVA